MNSSDEESIGVPSTFWLPMDDSDLSSATVDDDYPDYGNEAEALIEDRDYEAEVTVEDRPKRSRKRQIN
ncbi:hypothetical protein J6590_097792 [Homalodisca vitripennis]|nr:hypothetical protein J6590_097792 [Homalodisca vitripennis]